ncbi:bifunctional 5,10-methylenetetrahydrofolate dehydrogenase/5,10-methenyltetrahydrofolate cyclohydrolase [Clostridiaceae bacterium OttesenSCG-928-D20]|nr:bifunctional 5,10-methylenetetrahydrofolate dehydrogenase/5,10-methenyltetrahydrofolate cyclohydrolase [Clostridiaceae bacterium OttesenSCG-928-D20]
MAEILKGSEVVASLNEKMAADIKKLNANNIHPTLAILRVGERADDLSYERGAKKRCETVGVHVHSVALPEDVSQEDLEKELKMLNLDHKIHGILLFRPLPKHIDEEKIRSMLSPSKDIDGITDISMAGVFTNTKIGYTPCTAQACIEILDHYGIDCKGKKAVVIGRSLVVGKPVANLLLAKNATVTVCHTRTIDIPSHTKDADIVIVAAGRAETIGAEYFSGNQIVIDVGINWSDEKQKLVGDVDFESAVDLVSAITPVPGGVGTVTTSVLVSHVVEAANRTLSDSN